MLTHNLMWYINVTNSTLKLYTGVEIHSLKSHILGITSFFCVESNVML